MKSLLKLFFFLSFIFVSGIIFFVTKSLFQNLDKGIWNVNAIILLTIELFLILFLIIRFLLKINELNKRLNSQISLQYFKFNDSKENYLPRSGFSFAKRFFLLIFDLFCNPFEIAETSASFNKSKIYWIYSSYNKLNEWFPLGDFNNKEKIVRIKIFVIVYFTIYSYTYSMFIVLLNTYFNIWI
jgi:hypothetical protein